MHLLRLTQTAVTDASWRVELSLERERAPRQTATAAFPFALTPQDEADLRWYLEDYLQWPQDPAPAIAARVEERMRSLGSELFRAIFQHDDDCRELWSAARHDLAATRLEVITTVEHATAIPWELVRDPRTDTALALGAHSFVRAQPTAARTPRLPADEAGPVRVLLVICRPRAGDDVPFRSVAGRLIKGLGADARELFDLRVLRPPTFEQLGRELRRARGEGRPYHVVHFDGHGVYTEVEQPGALQALLAGLSPLLLSSRRQGQHGYLLFENPELDENMQLVDGPALGKLLVEAEVPVLVLNACRSAHAEPRQAPEADGGDVHARTRALGSLAQEVMDAGVAGVVAMGYNVYVVTAAQFVAELYAALGRGPSLGEAVTLGRKNLADQPLREVAADPLPLQDWTVPVVYEAAPTVPAAQPRSRARRASRSRSPPPPGRVRPPREDLATASTANGRRASKSQPRNRRTAAARRSRNREHGERPPRVEVAAAKPANGRRARNSQPRNRRTALPMTRPRRRVPPGPPPAGRSAPGTGCTTRSRAPSCGRSGSSRGRRRARRRSPP